MDMPLTELMAYAVAFLVVAAPVFALSRGRPDASAPAGRGPGAEMPAPYRLLWRALEALEFPVGRPLAAARPERTRELVRMIEASALALTPEKVYALQMISCLAATAVGALFASTLPGLLPDYPPLLLLGAPTGFMAFVGWVYPALTLESYVKDRKEELVRSLPFAIDLLASAMRAGLEFGAALRYYVGLRMKGPLTVEFAKVLQQTELGKTRTEALKAMADRIRIEPFTAFVGMVSYGTEIGASISDMLMVHGEELRRARFHLAERKAQRAPSLMILPMVLFIVPAVFVIIITPVMMQMKVGG